MNFKLTGCCEVVLHTHSDWHVQTHLTSVTLLHKGSIKVLPITNNKKVNTDENNIYTVKMEMYCFMTSSKC